jgi:PAS domain S-box-containing protein
MTIKQKIVGKSVVTSLLVAAVGLLGAASMLQISNNLRTTVATELHDSIDSDQLQGAASTIDGLIDEYGAAVQNHQPADSARLVAEVDSALDQIVQTTARLDQAIRHQPADTARNGPDDGDIGDYRRELDLIEQQARLALAGWSELRSEMKDGAEPSSAVLNRLTLATGGLLRDSQDFEAGAKADMSSRLQVLQDRIATSVRLLTATAAFAVILAISMALLLAVPLVSRLARLRDGAVQIGKGNLDARINIGPGDEIGQLAAAFNEMAGSLKESRDKIKASESSFRELAETIRDVFWVCDSTCATVHYVSPAYAEVWGRSRESVYKNGRSFAEAIVPEDRPRVLAALETLATSGYDEEYRIARPDGTTRWIHARGFCVRGEAGQVERIVGIATDVTRQKIAEDALRTAHAELEQRVDARTAELRHANEALRLGEADLQRAKDAAEAANHARSVVFDTALDAIVTVDSAGRITDWNLQAETMFRWDRTEVVGLRLDETIVPQCHWDAHRQAIEAFLKTGDGPLLNTVAEIVAVRRDGREFPVEVAITPACSDGQCTFTAFIRDITARKQIEAELRQAKDAAETASRAKSDFLAKMSHEIRTPLNGVIGVSGLLLDTTLDEKQRHFVDLIKTSGVSLSELVNDLLDFSKIEARKLEIESVDFDLYAAIEQVTEMMSLRASLKRLDLACLTTPDVPRQVKGDAQRIKQIAINLVNNAIKFTDAGAITMRLTLDEQMPEGVIVKFSITDTGIGIPADRMDRLFKSFSQVDSSTTRIYGGTGLGLAISKQLAELMGGRIGVESTVGEGSTFWFTVKLGRGSQALQLVPTTSPTAGHWRVLAAHASPMMRETLRSQLSCWGLEASMASTADEAMAMLIDAAATARPYDVAILDGELPNTDAMELGKQIKSRPEIAGTVLLILLPMGGDFEPLKLRAAGFCGHLVKPIRQSRLFDSIVDAMASASMPNTVLAQALPVATSFLGNAVAGTPRARILLAEDNRVNQIVASELLAKHGYACDIVDNGREALAAVLGGSYDLVLMDCLMPELDGFEATAQIRQKENADPAKALRHTPIIALTANAINGDRERCLEVGMDDYVSKPIVPDRLINSVKKLLAKSGQKSPTQPAVSPAERPAVSHAEPPAMSPVEPPAMQAPAASASAVAPDPTPPLEIDALLDRCMGNVETVRSILDEFERQAIADLAEITRHVEGGDCKETARVAHTLKSVSGILSAAALSDVAFKLERMGRAGVIVEAEQMLARLNNEVHRCIDYLPAARAAISKHAAT